MLTVKDIAKKLNISIGAVYKAISSGELECHRFGNAIRISPTQLDEFLESAKHSSRDQVPLRRFKHL